MSKEFFKFCPVCNIKVYFKNKNTLSKSIKNNSKCHSCRNKESNTLAEYNKKVKEGLVKNGFEGKKHTEESKKKMSNKDTSVYKTEEFKALMSSVTKGEKNGMFGKSVYSVWVEKYGKDVADEKMIEYKKKQSLSNTGINNNMYGKPSPSGSGNGWSGWYKGWFFRSLLELSYMVNVIERFNLKWSSAETSNYKIPYIGDNNQERTYTADFIIANKYVVEIKPKNLHNSKQVLFKKKFAEKWCEDNSMVYKITYCKKLTDEEILKLIETGEIVLTKRYKDKFDEKYKK